MKTIVWTYKHFTEEVFKDHPDYMKHCVIAISNDEVVSHNFTYTGKTYHEAFNSKEEAIRYIEQICKPKYYEAFGAGYELKYVDTFSEEWFQTFDKWETYYNNLKYLVEYLSLPWYKKLWINIKIKLNF